MGILLVVAGALVMLLVPYRAAPALDFEPRAAQWVFFLSIVHIVWREEEWSQLPSLIIVILLVLVERCWPVLATFLFFGFLIICSLAEENFFSATEGGGGIGN